MDGAAPPNCPDDRGTRTRPTRSDTSWLNDTSFDPPNHTSTLVSPTRARASCSPKIAAYCRNVCAA